MGRSLPEILARYNPEVEFKGLDLPKDKTGEGYLPLNVDISKPLAIDPDQPGKGIMVHMMDEYNDPIPIQLGSIREEGFLALRRKAHFSTGPFPWGIGKTTEAVVCRTPSRWSREYLDPPEIACSRWAEGLIGLPLDEASEVAPEGARYILDPHKKDKDGHWAASRRRQAELTGVFAYIPPSHFLGGVKFFGHEYWGLMDECTAKMELFMRGDITETDYAGWLCGRVGDREIEPLGDGSYEPDAEKFWGMVAAAHTQSELLDEVLDLAAGKLESTLANVRTSYPKTTAMKQEALSTFGNYR